MSKTTFSAKFLSFARAVQMLLIYSVIRRYIWLMCNLKNSKRATFRSKRVRFALQKVSVSAMLVDTLTVVLII